MKLSGRQLKALKTSIRHWRRIRDGAVGDFVVHLFEEVY